MISQLEQCLNIESQGVQDITRWGKIPVYEMTREPKCDKRKDRKEAR